MPTWPALMAYVDDLCGGEGLFGDVKHVPVQILTMEEFEALLDLSSAGRSLLWLLRDRGTHPSEREESMRNYLYRHQIERAPENRLPFLKRSFDRLHELVMETLSGGQMLE